LGKRKVFRKPFGIPLFSFDQGPTRVLMFCFISYSQWMVLDYKKFTPGQPVVPETLWLLEQLPGMVQMADLSLYLKQNGYWASYNIPYVTCV
jgi:hypothetical protein